MPPVLVLWWPVNEIDPCQVRVSRKDPSHARYNLGTLISYWVRFVFVDFGVYLLQDSKEYGSRKAKEAA